jgi:alkylhydroperoxidase/carboxymuconolactone decarboxylase family protein YurZ
VNPNQDITQLLDPEQLAELRRHYDDATMTQLLAQPLRATYPPCEPWLDWVSQHLYNRERFRPEYRELILITVLGSNPHGGGRLLAIHLYVGLMVGLSPSEVADALLLVGVYTGIPSFTFGVYATLTKTLAVLRQAVEQGGEALGMQRVLKSLAEAFA